LIYSESEYWDVIRRRALPGSLTEKVLELWFGFGSKEYLYYKFKREQLKEAAFYGALPGEL
jgi:hypothetical protein